MEKHYDSDRMSSAPLVSIVVPVYKVENYLRRCVDSILSQTYENFELILVDDGSPDRCGAICDEYASKHSCIQVIHQDNQGQAAARNNALAFAKGELVTFIDSDDYVESDYLEYLVAIKQKYQADMAVGGFLYFYEGKEPSARPDSDQDEALTAEETICRMNYGQGMGCTACPKLYSKQLLLRHPFPEGKIYEDLSTLYKIVGDCTAVAYGTRRIYYWTQRMGSTTRMMFDERQMYGMEAASAQIAYVEKAYPNALPSAKYRHTAKAVELIAICFNSGGDKAVFRRLRGMMKEYADEVLHDNCAKKTMKIRIVAVKMGYYPAKIVFWLHETAKEANMMHG